MKELIERIKQKQVILFVGAGVSATVNLPTWDQMMDYIADSLSIDRELFRMYGDNLTLAEYYTEVKGSTKPLIEWMRNNWMVEDETIRKSKIYDYICKLNFPIIYTTNYDNCLERAYKLHGMDFKKITKVDDLCHQESGHTQIIKFHGDYEEGEEIVLTESNYFQRLDFESPLDIKLRADFLGKSVLFIGYSLSDINMRYLLYKLNQIWQSGNHSYRPKSYIFMTIPNPIQESIWESRNIVPLVGEGLDQTLSLEQFLKKLADARG